MFVHILITLLAITGALVWGFVLWSIIRTIPHAVICAASVLRCQRQAMRQAGRNPKWPQLPRAFFHHFWEFLGTTRGSLSFTGQNWAWRGVGDWNVDPPVAPTPASTPAENKAPSAPLLLGSALPESVSDGGDWPRHERFTMADWADLVNCGGTNQGYSAFVVDRCIEEGVPPPSVFIKNADREDDLLTRKDPSRSSAHLDDAYPRTHWTHEVNNEDTRLGWRAWQLHQDDAANMEREISEVEGQE